MTEAQATRRDVFAAALDDRTLRAAAAAMASHETAPGLWTVWNADGDAYAVEPDLGACTCGDMQYRNPDGGCKHIRRVELRTGARPLPPGIRIDPTLRINLDHDHDRDHQPEPKPMSETDSDHAVAQAHDHARETGSGGEHHA